MKAQDFQRHLEENLIPFWNGMRDDEQGGFYGYADEKGNPDKKHDKGVILHSRILWFYSAAYLLLKKQELLDMAEHGYQFLNTYCFDKKYGGVYWSVTYDGKAADDQKHTYNQAFSIYALSLYYQASGKKEVLDRAYENYRLIEKTCRDENGYLEAFHRDFTPADNEQLSENGVLAERTMNTLLHVFESYFALYRADGSEEVAASLREILKIFKEKIYNPAEKSCDVFFDMDYQSLIDLRSYGHDIETSWLLDRGCQILGDKDCLEEMLPLISGLAEGTYENGMNPEKSAMNAERERGKMDEKKIWWVQAEAVTGFYNAYQRNPEKTEYLETAERIWKYIQEHVIDPESGEWFENLKADGEPYPKQALVHAWKCPYHNGRMCIEMIRRLS